MNERTTTMSLKKRRRGHCLSLQQPTITSTRQFATIGTSARLGLWWVGLAVVWLSSPQERGRGVDAFVAVGLLSPITTTGRRISERMTRIVRLRYKDDQSKVEEEDDDDEDGSNGEGGERLAQPSRLQSQRKSSTTQLSLPVLGPLWKQPPLFPSGQEFVLTDPTPMQWQTLEQCAIQHAAHLSTQKNNSATVATSTTTTGVTAAPLVLLLDEYTTYTHAAAGLGSSSHMTTPGDTTIMGRYATIAAILGMSSSTASSIGSACSGSSSRNTLFGLRTSGDNADFTESLQNSRTAGSDSGKVRSVRFMGIGRALVTDFFYQSVHQDAVDDEGHLLHVPSHGNLLTATTTSDDDDEENEIDESDAHHDCDTTNHIIMARFQLFRDVVVAAASHHPQKSRVLLSPFASPVHALAVCSQWTSKLHSLHQERQQLVAGLQAAEARLLSAKYQQEQQQKVDSDNDDEDYDGFGLLFASKQQQQQMNNEEAEERHDQQDLIEQILHDHPVTAEALGESTVMGSSSSPLEGLSNYGLGVTALAVSTLAAATAQQLERLRPYYSPSRHSSEEHYYEIYSFVALLALRDSHPTPQQQQQQPHAAVAWESTAAWAVRQCPSTADRFQYVWERMWEHVLLLRQEVAAKSHELQDCGEECTDLW